jgi:hypothetical protein
MSLRSFVLPRLGDILQRRPDKCHALFCVGWSSTDYSWLFIELENVCVNGVHRFNIVAVKDGRPSSASMVRHVLRLPWMRNPQSVTPEEDRNITFGCSGGRLLIIYNSWRYHLREGGNVYDGSTRGWAVVPGFWNYNLGYSARHGWIMHSQPTRQARRITVFGCVFQSGGFFIQTTLCVFFVFEEFNFVMLWGEDSLIFVEQFPGPGESGYTEELMTGHVIRIWVHSIVKGCHETYVYDGEICSWFWQYSEERAVSFWCHNGRMIMLSYEHQGDQIFCRYHLYPVVLNEEKRLWSLGSRYFSYPKDSYTTATLDFNFSLDNADLNIILTYAAHPTERCKLEFYSASFVSPPTLWDLAKRSMYSVKDSYCSRDYGGYVGRAIDSMNGTSL